MNRTTNFELCRDAFRATEQPLTSDDVARITGLTRKHASSIVSQLCRHQKFVRKIAETKMPGVGGRVAFLYELNPQSLYDKCRNPNVVSVTGVTTSGDEWQKTRRERY